MADHLVKDKYYVYKGEKTSEVKFRTELSKLIIKKFGAGPFPDQNVVREIVIYSLDYYINKFKNICLQEKSVTFYQNIFWYHEQATDLVHLYPHQDFSSIISGRYVSEYRRILKFIIEMGCEVQLVSGEISDINFKKRMEPIFSDLIFLGHMILMCVDLYAEQTMIEDVAKISFDKKGLYEFSRNHHYEFIFEYIINELGSQLTKSIVDNNGLRHFKDALQNCFQIRYEDVGHLIATIHKELETKGGYVVGVGWETFTVNLSKMFGVPTAIAEQFFRGLRLYKANKMDLLSLACKPYKLNRYLYRPIIIWNIDGNDFALLGKNSWTETIIQYATNAIPWGKAPEEWIKNKCFKEYVHRKEDEHDKWLDDSVEERLNNQKVHFDRNIKHLKTKNGSVSIDVQGIGEVDFIIISDKIKKIFISDCKHLLGRYDIVNQKNDYNAFSKGSKKNKSYNETMKAKLVWFNNNKELIQEHFQIKYNDKNISLKEYTIEGIFIVNTPTFYMYNADYRIYTITQIEDVLIGEFTDPTFMVVIEEDEYEKILNVKYPYFRKPAYLTFDPFNEDDE
jgi:hypothetical protein